MGIDFAFQWELDLIAWMQSWIGNFGVILATLITELGDKIVLVGLLVFLYFYIDKRYAVFVGTNVISSLLFNPMLKNIVCRYRPYFYHDSIQCLKPVESSADIYDVAAQGYSFPSGHAQNAASAFASLALYKKKKWLTVLAIVLPLLVAVSRFALGVHYPTDVLVGLIAGYTFAFVLSAIQKRIHHRWILYLSIMCLAIPGCFFCATDDYFSILGIAIGFFSGDLLETRFVQFAQTPSTVRKLLRFIGGIAVFLALNFGQKYLYIAIFQDPAVWLSNLLRVFRYAVDVVLVMAVYPLIFRVTAGIGSKEKQQ